MKGVSAVILSLIVVGIVAAGLVTLGIVVLLVMVARAPQGYEDQLGYHANHDPREHPQPSEHRL